MEGPRPPGFEEARGTSPRSRWPDVIGIIGIILSIVIFIDKLDDLVTLTWTEEEWARIIGAPLADAIVRALPPIGWRLASSLAQMALAVFLFTSSLPLRRRRRAGISRLRTWAVLAIAWVVVEIGWATWWLSQYPGGFMGIPAATWQGYAAIGIVVALVVLLAFPVFLVIWFSRSDVREEYARWPG